MRDTTRLTVLTAGLICLASSPLPAQPAAQPATEPAKRMSPTLIGRAEARILVERTLDACEAKHETASVYVLDADGNLRAAGSSDNGLPSGLRSASAKAATVLAFKASTSALAERLKTDRAFADQVGNDPHYSFHQGGVPLYRDGRFVGVAAAGGGHTADEACVLVALADSAWAKPAP